MWPPLVSERKKGKRCCCGTGLVHPVACTEETRPEPIHASAGRQLHQQAVGPSGCQGDGKRFSSFFLLSFLYLFIFKLFQIKFSKPNQNKINAAA
jgi:hypothetical protein